MGNILRAGFGKGIIHFAEEMLPLEGFCGIHDDPHIRLMVLKTGQEELAILAAELVNIPKSAIARWRTQIAEAFAMEEQKVLIHMTHAITTPHEPGPMGPPDKRPEPSEEDIRKKELFHASIDAAAEEAIIAARADFSEARVGIGTGHCDVSVNRDIHTPFGWWIGARGEGISNHTMTILKLEDLQGNTKGLLVSYGLKPCAVDNAGMREGIRLISSEVCGAFCRQMEEVYQAPTLYCMSAAANQVPYRTALTEWVDEDGNVQQQDEGPERGFAYMDEVSRRMTKSARNIVDKISTAESAKPAGWKYVSFEWTRRKGGPRRLIRELTHTPDGSMEVRAEIFGLGEIAFVAVRPEVTAELEAELLAGSPYTHTLLLSMTNGEMKYLPDERGFALGTWEAQSSMLMPGGADRLLQEITDKLTELLNDEVNKFKKV